MRCSDRKCCICSTCSDAQLAELMCACSHSFTALFMDIPGSSGDQKNKQTNKKPAGKRDIGRAINYVFFYAGKVINHEMTC